MEQQHQLDSDFKLKHFGYGEWVEEPDLVKFEHNGIECCIVRVVKREPFCPKEVYFGGHLCGYVCIPADHPYLHKKFEDMNIECHGGLTWGNVSVGHWIGFDCGHAGDLVPSMKKMRDESPEMKKFDEMFPIPEEWKDSPLFHNTYKNISYCIEECKSIADQLNVIKNLENIDQEIKGTK